MNLARLEGRRAHRLGRVTPLVVGKVPCAETERIGLPAFLQLPPNERPDWQRNWRRAASFPSQMDARGLLDSLAIEDLPSKPAISIVYHRRAGSGFCEAEMGPNLSRSTAYRTYLSGLLRATPEMVDALLDYEKDSQEQEAYKCDSSKEESEDEELDMK
jgi:hypothetical protein